MLINSTVSFINDDLGSYKNKTEGTVTTSDGTIFYNFPAGVNRIETAVIDMDEEDCIALERLLKGIDSGKFENKRVRFIIQSLGPVNRK
jgi:hypothetical protein